MQGCFDNCIKYLLFIFNVIFAISGLILIIIGGIYLTSIRKWDSLDKVHDVTTPQIVVIVIGCFIFLIASVGCCGAIKEIKCKLYLFAIFLLVLFFVQLIIGIYALVVFSSVKDGVADEIGRRFKDIKTDEHVESMVDKMQVQFSCCAMNGPSDYKEVQIPDTCCQDNRCNMDYSNVFKKGCRESVSDFVGFVGKLIGGIAMGFSFIEIIGALLSWRLARDINRPRY